MALLLLTHALQLLPPTHCCVLHGHKWLCLPRALLKDVQRSCAWRSIKLLWTGWCHVFSVMWAPAQGNCWVLGRMDLAQLARCPQ